MSRRPPVARIHEHGRTGRLRRAMAVLLLASGVCTAAPGVAAAASSDPATFADPAFRACVAANLGLPPSAPLTEAKVATLTSLDCGELSPASLDGAQALTNLASLSFASGSTVSDLAPLAGLTNLRELVLPMSKVSDLSPLRSLTGLTKLDVYGNPVVGLEPLAALTGLTYLDVTGASWTTLEPLRPLTRLRRLSVDAEGQVDIAALGALTGLRRLDLVVPDVRSLAPLRTLTGLTQLTVQAAATDVSALAPLARLRTLSLNVAGGDGAALAGKPELTELSAYGVRLPSLDVLASSTQLSWLVLVAPAIRDVTTLRAMTQLSELTVSGLDRADLSPLGRLPQLSYLSISESRLGPLSQLDGFEALSTLALNADRLESLAGFRVPANLSSLDVSGNRLADLGPLRCGLLVNALAQTVDAGPATVGQAYALPLASVPGQAVRLGTSSAWTSTGTSITYSRAGMFRVPFVAEAAPECGEVQLAGTVTQVASPASTGRFMRPPLDR